MEEMKKMEKGFAMLRLPEYVREQMNEGVKNSLASTGVEIQKIAENWKSIMEKTMK